MSVLTTENFREAQTNRLELFDLPAYQTAVERVYYQDVRPVSQITESSPLEFSISGNNGLEYLDLKNSKLYLKLRIKNADGTDINEESKVGPVNNFFAALFSDCEVTFQGKTCFSNNHYAYKAYIQTILGYSQETMETQLSTQLFIKDTPGAAMEDTDPISGPNLALYQRSNYISKSKYVDLEGPLFADVFKIEKFILNQVNVHVRLHRTKPEFALMCSRLGAHFRIDIEEAVLRACKVQCQSGIIIAHSLKLEETNAKYPFVKSDVRMVVIPRGQSYISLDSLFQNTSPRKLVVGFVKAEAVAGKLNSNPFNFAAYKLTNISVSVNGSNVASLKVNYDDEGGQTIVSALTNIMESGGFWLKNSTCNITREDIQKGGYCLYPFNLEPIFRDGNYLSLLRQGNVRLEVQFAEALPETVTAVIYSETLAYFEVNKARDIITE